MQAILNLPYIQLNKQKDEEETSIRRIVNHYQGNTMYYSLGRDRWF